MIEPPTRPDICFWANEKAVAFGQKQSVFPPPDFSVEILSDSTRNRDWIASPVVLKKDDYARHGVREYWLVDTETRTVEQYSLAGNDYELAQKLKNGLLTSDVITSVQITLDDMLSE